MQLNKARRQAEVTWSLIRDKFTSLSLPTKAHLEITDPQQSWTESENSWQRSKGWKLTGGQHLKTHEGTKVEKQECVVTMLITCDQGEVSPFCKSDLQPIISHKQWNKLHPFPWQSALLKLIHEAPNISHPQMHSQQENRCISSCIISRHKQQSWSWNTRSSQFGTQYMQMDYAGAQIFFELVFNEKAYSTVLNWSAGTIHDMAVHILKKMISYLHLIDNEWRNKHHLIERKKKVPRVGCLTIVSIFVSSKSKTIGGQLGSWLFWSTCFCQAFRCSHNPVCFVLKPIHKNIFEVEGRWGEKAQDLWKNSKEKLGASAAQSTKLVTCAIIHYSLASNSMKHRLMRLSANRLKDKKFFQQTNSWLTLNEKNQCKTSVETRI